MPYKATLLGRVLTTPGLNETHGFPDSDLVDQSRGLSHQLRQKKKVTHAKPYISKPRPGTRYAGQEPTPEHVPEAARKTERSGEKLSRKNRGPMTESSLKASDLIGGRPVNTGQQGGSGTYDRSNETRARRGAVARRKY